MNDKVYLFELDSVITSERECRAAQEKLYMELMNGNTVVLSYNQILSVTMFDLLDISQVKYTRKHILNLIKKKRICVSMYNDCETPNAYITSKMVPGADAFKFSCMRFLNRFDKDHSIFAEIKKVLEGRKTWRSWRDISSGDLENHEKKVLYDYIDVMQDLTHKIYAVPPAEHKMFDFEYYIRKVSSAIASMGVHFLGYRSDMIEAAIEKNEHILNEFRITGNNINRSSFVTMIDKLENVDGDTIKLCKAILDISYNYQVERSISGLTVLHDTDDAYIAKLVADYYYNHEFVNSDEIILNKDISILSWEIVDRFCDSKKRSGKERIPYKIKVLIKQTAKTFLWLAVVVAMFLANDYFDGISDLLGPVFLFVWIVLEFISWLIPSSVLDGCASVIELSKYYKAYFNYKKGLPSYIKVNIKDLILDKFKESEGNE